MQGRGSKHGDLFPVVGRAEVAPHAGAWIETARSIKETSREMSPLMQGRGSKLWETKHVAGRPMSPLMQGRGSKHRRERSGDSSMEAQPIKGRGSTLLDVGGDAFGFLRLASQRAAEWSVGEKCVSR